MKIKEKNTKNEKSKKTGSKAKSQRLFKKTLHII